MAARKQIDLEAFKRDYETGMSCKDLETKYGFSRNGTSYWACKAGCNHRDPRGRHYSKGEKSKPQRRTAIVRAPQNEILRSAQNDSVPDGSANGAGKANCRVVMFELAGSDASIQAALEAVKSALSRG